MKKLPLVLAFATLFSSSIVLAQTTAFTDTPVGEEPILDTRIFTKEFGLFVKKESHLDVVMPRKEIVVFDIDEMMEANTKYKSKIGLMKVDTTAKVCSARIQTKNGFVLKGVETQDFLAAYRINYMPHQTPILVDKDETTGLVPPKPPMRSIVFGEGLPSVQKVSCNSALLEMAVVKMNPKAKADVYSDIVRVEVRAES